MNGLSLNLRNAKAAVTYVQERVSRGSGNQASSPVDGAACVQYLRSTMVSTANFIPHLAARAEELGCGNCGEQAAVAYMYLLNRGVRPLNYMNLYTSEGTAIHSFVLIDSDFTEGQTSSWGSDAVICDPWDEGQAYAAPEITFRMSLFTAGYTVQTIHRDAR